MRRLCVGFVAVAVAASVAACGPGAGSGWGYDDPGLYAPHSHVYVNPAPYVRQRVTVIHSYGCGCRRR